VVTGSKEGKEIDMATENERWLLSYYRTSEIGGALFFGRMARALKPGPMQEDMTQHFADESNHASYWTHCLGRLGVNALRLNETYQDQYATAVGVPVNMMEVLSITQVFEKRVINQYARHMRVPDLSLPVKETLHRIMADEKWHLQWVKKALRDFEGVYGAEVVRATVARHGQADHEIWSKAVLEHGERITFAAALHGAGVTPAVDAAEDMLNGQEA
jgi:bacterioferritin (cytochrome b1)